jgi:signal transduction histidine kinase
VSERSSRLRDPRTWSPEVIDALIALAVTAFCFTAFLTAEPSPEHDRDADVLGGVIVLVGAGSIAFRRRWPVVTLLVVMTATVAQYVLDYSDSGLPMVVLFAVYTMAAHSQRRVTVQATLAVLFATTFIVADAGDLDTGTLVGWLALFALAAVLGDRKKVRDAYSEQLELRAAEKERERLEATRRAVGEERLRIARELHDVVAHNMSVVAVQAGVGAHVIDTRPDEAKRILETISLTSRDSLDEMRRMLGVLRSEPGPLDPTDRPVDEPAGLDPAPGLDRLDELAARVTEAGVPVEVEIEGKRKAIPAGVDLAAYRIVQEALTNVLKHAGAAHASVRVRYQRGSVHIEVLDDGRGAASGATTGNGSGHGLVGMRERAALYDGDLDAGPRPGGGYRVAATMRYTVS